MEDGIAPEVVEAAAALAAAAGRGEPAAVEAAGAGRGEEVVWTGKKDEADSDDAVAAASPGAPLCKAEEGAGALVSNGLGRRTGLGTKAGGGGPDEGGGGAGAETEAEGPAGDDARCVD